MNNITVCSECYWLSQNRAGKTCTNPDGPCQWLDDDVKFSIVNKSLKDLKLIVLIEHEGKAKHA